MRFFNEQLIIFVTIPKYRSLMFNFKGNWLTSGNN